MNKNSDKSEGKTDGSEMNTSVAYQEFVSVGEAATILGVSIDTVRRWDTKGILSSQRLDGKNRFFAVEDLEAFKSTQKLSTTEVAKILGVSVSTVRRYETQGLLIPERDSQGMRMYEPDAVAALQGVTVTAPTQVEAPLVLADKVADNPTITAPAPKRHKQINGNNPFNKMQDPMNVIFRMKRWQQVILWLVVGCITLFALLMLLFLVSPDTAARLFGYKARTNTTGTYFVQDENPNFLNRALTPIADTAMSAASLVNPDITNEVVKIDANAGYFIKTRNGEIEPKRVISLPGSSYIKVPDQGLIVNLNSEYVGGYKPGTGTGNLAVLPISGNSIQNKSITGSQIADGTIQLANLSSSAISSLRSGSGSTSGSTFTSGAQGSTGPQGPQGPTGATGLQGPQGPVGPAGADGSSSPQTIVAGQGLNGGGNGSVVTLNVNAGVSTQFTNNALEVKVATSGTTSTTSSPSGLEVTGQGVSLIGGCSNNQILIWNGSAWACGNQAAGGGGGSINVQASDGSVSVANITNLNFGPTSGSASQFSIINTGGGGVRVQLGTNVLLTTNYSSTLDSVYVNTSESPLSGDIIGSFGSGLQLAAGAVQLGSDTTGNYVASVAGGSGLAASGSGVGAAVTLGLNLASSGTTGTASSISGLEIDSNGAARLLGGCAATQILKWNGTAWACGNDNSSSLDIKSNGTTVTSGASSINLSTDFAVSNVVTQANVSIDYAASGITRRNSTESITGTWNFNDSSFALQDNADSTKKASFELGGISAGVTRSLAIPDVNGTLITTGNLGAITTVGTITSGTWQGGTIAVANGGTGTTSFITNGILYGNGTGAIQNTVAGTSGQVLLANALGVPSFTSINGDATLASTGALTIANAAVTNAKLANSSLSVTAGTGLSGGGSISLGGSGTLNVVYGAAANTAAQGNSSIGFTGAGNLTGTITGTAGGGITANTLDIRANPTFGTSVTSPLFTGAGTTLSSTGAGNDLVLSTGRNITLSGFNCAAFNNGGVLTTDASGNIVCQNDDGGAAGTITGSGTTNRISFYSGSNSLGDSYILQSGTGLQIDTGKNLELISGDLIVAGTTVLTSGRVLQNVTADGGIINNGTLSNAKLANSSLTVTAGTGISGGGSVSLGGSSSGLSVIYGSTANTSAQGNTAISFSGSGNLTGLVSGTAGGGITTNTLALINNPSFSGLVSANGGLTVASGQQLTNAGSTLLTAMNFADLAAGGNIGIASTSVDVATTLNVAQTTAGQNLALPAPTVTTAGRIIYVTNVGTASFTMYNFTLSPGQTQTFMWRGSAWNPISNQIAGTGVTIAGNTISTAAATSVVNDTNIQGSISGNALTLSFAGTLAVSRGGTGATSFTSNGLVFGNGTGALQATAAGTSGQLVVANGSGTPTFVSLSGDATLAAGGGLTLANTLVTPGTYGDATSVGQFTVDSKGRITGASSVAISGIAPSGAADGDLGGNYPSPTIAKFQGTTLSISSLASGQIMQYNGTNWVNQTVSGDVSISNTGATTIAAASVTGAKIASSTITNTNLVAGSFGNITAVGTLDSLSVAGGAFSVNASGAVTAATGITSSGAITLSSLNTPGFVRTNASGLLSTSSITLGTDTAGNYVATLGTLTGLSTTGNTGAGSSPTLAVIYGSGANNAAQGNTSLSFTGAGNLTGGITATAGGGVTANTLNVVTNPSFSGLITGSAAGAGLAITGAPTNTATASLVQFGSAIAGGNSVANGGTYLGLNAPASGAGSAADFLNFQNNGTSRVRIDASGAVTAVSFGGNGSALTSLNANNISSGTVANSYLTNSGALTVTAGTGLSGGGSVALGGTTTVNLADTTVTANSYGSASSVATFTVDAQGRLTTAGSTPIAIATSAITSGNYVATLGTLTGLTATGNTGTGSTPTLSVSYGSTANTAAEGSTSLSFTGAGNLSGSLSGTAGGGFTTTTLDVRSNPSFTGLITGSAAGTGLAVTGAPTSSSVASLIQVGAAIFGGNSAANGGTYLGLNAPASGAGSAADFLNFQTNGTYKLKVLSSGLLDTAGGLAVNGTTVITNAATPVLQNVTADAGIIGSGSFGVSRGGTGITSYTAGDLLYASGAGSLAKLALGSSGQCLQAGVSAPVWTGCASGSLFSIAGSTGSPQSISGGSTLSILAGNSGNITSVAATGPQITIDIANNPTFTTSVTTPSLLSSAALAITAGGIGGVTINSSNSTVASTGAITIQSGSATTGSNLSAGTVSIDTGTKTGAGTATLTLGNINATTVNIGNTGASFALDSNAFRVSAAGAVSGLTTLSLSGAITGATGLTGAGALAIAAGGTAQNLTLNGSTSGRVQIGATSTGDIELGGGSASTGCTVTNASGNLTCSGTINGATISGGTVSGGTLTATAVNTLNVSGTAITGTSALAIASGSIAQSISLDGSTTGQVLLGGTSTGDILIGGGSGSTGCTVANATGAFACTSTVNGATLSGGTLSGGSISGGTLTATAVNSLLVSGTAITGTSGLSIAAGGTAQNISVDASTSGQVFIGGTSTGDILLGGGLATTGCTVTNASGNFACTGTLNGATISAGTLSGGSVSGGTLTATTVNGLNLSSTALSVVAAATNLTIDAGTSGKVLIGATSTGDIELGGGSASTGCTVTNASGNFACTGTLNGATISAGTLSGGSVSGGTLTATAVNALLVSGTAITGTGGLTVAAGGTAQNLTLEGSTTGQVIIGGTSSGDILFGGGSASTGCTVTNASGNFACTGTINGATLSGGTLSGGNISGSTLTTSALTFTAASTATIQPAASQALNITANAASTWSTSGAATLTVQSGSGTLSLGTTTVLTASGALTVDSNTTSALNIGTGANAKTITVGNVTGATGLVVNTGTAGVTFNSVAGGQLKVTSGTNVPTIDQVLIDNSGSTGVITANVSALQIVYKGGAAAIESSAARIDLTSGTTAGGIWNGLRLTGAAPSFGVTQNLYKAETAALTQTTAATTIINGFNLTNAGALTQSVAAGTINWNGANITTPTVTQSTGTIAVNGVQVTVPSNAITAGGTINGFSVAPIAVGVAAGTLNGISIGALTTAGAGTETGLRIGNGWDVAIDIGTGLIRANGVNGATLGTACTAAQGVNGQNIRGGISIAAAGCTNFVSDQRVKTNYQDLSSSILDKIKDVRTLTFDFDCSTSYFADYSNICDTARQTGVLAQEIEKIFPGLVVDAGYVDKVTGEKYKAVNYDGLAIYTLKAVSELAKFVNSDGDANFGTLTANDLTTGLIMSDTVATQYTMAEQVSAGDVVALDATGSLRKATAPFQKGLLGTVVSTGNGRVSVATAGKVATKVTGPVAVGDLLTSSGVAGVAQIANGSGAVIGMATTAHSSTGQGTIIIAVQNSQVGGGSGNNQALQDQVNDLAAQVGSLSAGLTGADGQPVNFSNLKVGALEINLDTVANGGLTVAGPAEFKGTALFDALVTFGAPVDFNDEVRFNGNANFNSNTGGYAVIKAGRTAVRVTFAKPYAQAPVVSLTAGNNAGAKFYYQNVTTTGFDIVLDTTYGSDVNISWIALSVMGANTFVQQ